MFYVSELNLRGKGPLARLWQACHNPKKISKKIAEDFSYQEGFKAIVEPENDRIYALRLNGQLLLGFVRMHDAKVSFFQDTIKYAHDRLSLAFNAGLSKSVDMKISKKADSSKKDSITLSQSVVNDLSMLDIPEIDLKESHQTNIHHTSGIDQNTDLLKTERKQKSSMKSNKRKLKMDVCIQVSKEEQRMWVTDKEWQKELGMAKNAIVPAFERRRKMLRSDREISDELQSDFVKLHNDDFNDERGIFDEIDFANVAPDAFSFDESPHERSSRASGVSRFTSFGGLENDSVSRSLEFESQTLGFVQSDANESGSCVFADQLDGKISSHLPDEDSQLSFGSILKGRPSKRTASRCFYFLLTLMNENVVRLEQSTPYEEIQILPTANTAMYSA
ncbi:sister chromatid cohesin complex subunit Rad21/Scc1 [Guillardia theta CCMP2712]|uniref:Sister chromatid cohesin complex subunit Rad21/Scc1 n=1 Tax=Guillardia theta (strain CCMP2712) TaxID=905079 RepID=L1JPY6_GUITC|nr:sister chromatid cohesin complex subunit Rad21/Scc1 [Guillardia theta CCMP2712]EKX50314.1 sister chromatid cohesin complex subunit Rad21/Scc1 [Guillardia theta CCMP2712]|eukprot:XP_005837294.1 sister chromatid cohesin complex subunit Rad21/Scc1 [Guillardia theta CCMP2712]